MAIAPTMFPGEPGGALMSLLTQGLGVVNNAINNAINIGKDRATLQLNQEGVVFNELQNARNLELRKAQDMRRNFETDRLFKRIVGRDAKEDANKEQEFRYKVAKDSLDYTRLLSLDKAAAANTDADNKRADRAATLNEVQANVSLSNQLLNRQAVVKTEQKVDEKEAADADVVDIVARHRFSSPETIAKVPTGELGRYVDMLTGSTNPEGQDIANMARRELQKREPTVDAATGKQIPQRALPIDKDDLFKGRPPEEQAVVAQNLAEEIADYERALADPKIAKSRAGVALLNTLANRRLQLLKAPGGLQTPTATTPAGISVKSLYE